MKTRTSPRNQEILWKALGGPAPAQVVLDPVAAAERALAQPFLSPRTRKMLEADLVRAKHRAAVRQRGSSSYGF